MANELVSYVEAKAKGLKRYFTGKACRHGHIAERFVVSCACVVCVDLRNRKWMKTEHGKAIRRKVQQDFIARNPNYIQEWGDQNADKQAQHARRWYLKDPQRHVEVSTAWRKANPEKVRASVRNRTALRKAAEGTHTAQEIIELLDRQNWECAECGVSLKEKRHIDHIVPLSRGGPNYISNLQGLCPTCNCSKNARTPEEWARVKRGVMPSRRGIGSSEPAIRD